VTSGTFRKALQDLDVKLDPLKDPEGRAKLVSLFYEYCDVQSDSRKPLMTKKGLKRTIEEWKVLHTDLELQKVIERLDVNKDGLIEFEDVFTQLDDTNIQEWRKFARHRLAKAAEEERAYVMESTHKLDKELQLAKAQKAEEEAKHEQELARIRRNTVNRFNYNRSCALVASLEKAKKRAQKLRQRTEALLSQRRERIIKTARARAAGSMLVKTQTDRLGRSSDTIRHGSLSITWLEVGIPGNSFSLHMSHIHGLTHLVVRYLHVL
jgi:hypothetical protein